MPYVDVLHADIQGAEFEMLCDAEESLLNGRIGYVFVGTHSQQLHCQCKSFLGRQGYVTIAHADFDYGCSGPATFQLNRITLIWAMLMNCGPAQNSLDHYTHHDGHAKPESLDNAKSRHGAPIFFQFAEGRLRAVIYLAAIQFLQHRFPGKADSLH